MLAGTQNVEEHSGMCILRSMKYDGSQTMLRLTYKYSFVLHVCMQREGEREGQRERERERGETYTILLHLVTAF